MHEHFQGLVSVVEMATVLEEYTCTIEKQRSNLSSLWAKGLNAKYIHKEIFATCGGKRLSCKAVQNWVQKREKFSLMMFSIDVEKWLRQQSKSFYMPRVSTHW
jgi:excinuclease UvrABC ATPase subunit